MSQPFLEAQNLGRRDPQVGTWLLREISLAVRPEETWAIAGPSGAGKTLLLRSLALLDPLDEGEVRWRGAGVEGWHVPRFRRHVLYLHQRPAIFEGSVETNLRLPFSLHIRRGQGFDRSRILAWLQALDRDESFLTKGHRELSGGEAQLVALLRGIQLDPHVLLLDEPTSALDRETVQRVEGLVLGWLRERPDERALLWVSHDLEQARRLAERRIRLHQGRVVEVA